MITCSRIGLGQTRGEWAKQVTRTHGNTDVMAAWPSAPGDRLGADLLEQALPGSPPELLLWFYTQHRWGPSARVDPGGLGSHQEHWESRAVGLGFVIIQGSGSFSPGDVGTSLTTCGLDKVSRSPRPGVSPFLTDFQTLVITDNVTFVAW
ncbi:hypothetical protein E5288_WYG005125 [Bos mutus]|uniref:Uncharacterized protein n=1 Tax=Bos mutus TaxID=72004 RepID=A0A6B0S0B0_9CETA|nr:hypothetical protein [Bos mutus]